MSWDLDYVKCLGRVSTSVSTQSLASCVCECMLTYRHAF